MTMPPNLKREPTEVERAILELAKAIDACNLVMREVLRTQDKTLAMVEAINNRDSWVDAYRADDRAVFTGLDEVTHAQARHYIEPEGRE
jgi:hypothetical protein